MANRVKPAPSGKPAPQLQYYKEVLEDNLTVSQFYERKGRLYSTDTWCDKLQASNSVALGKEGSSNDATMFAYAEVGKSIESVILTGLKPILVSSDIKLPEYSAPSGKTLNLGGKVDAFCVDAHGDFEILEIKSSSKTDLQYKHRYQAASYAMYLSLPYTVLYMTRNIGKHAYSKMELDAQQHSFPSNNPAHIDTFLRLAKARYSIDNKLIYPKNVLEKSVCQSGYCRFISTCHGNDNHFPFPLMNAEQTLECEEWAMEFAQEFFLPTEVQKRRVMFFETLEKKVKTGHANAELVKAWGDYIS